MLRTGGRARPGVARDGAAPILTLVAAGVGVAVTAAILLTPYVPFGFVSPELHLVLNTFDAAIGALAAFLVHGRFSRYHRLQDLLLSEGLSLLVLASLSLNLAPAVEAGGAGRLGVWAPLVLRTVGACVVAAAALSGSQRLRPSPWQSWPFIPAGMLTVVVFSGLWLARSALPAAINLSSVPQSAQRPVFVGHPVLVIEAIGALALALAALGFTVQATARRDELLRWLGPSCALSAFARFEYALFPSLYTDWFYTGDLLRTGSYLLLLVGGAREIQYFWRMQSAVAVMTDRRRLARELHDGVIQELAYIKGQLASLPVTESTREGLHSACQRALDEARDAVHALSAEDDEPLGSTLRRVVARLARQYGFDAVVEVDDAVRADHAQRHALTRIVREAIANAVRHGRARTVTVSLNPAATGCVLRVCDDGDGFDEATLTSHGQSGYGMVSMRDRAAALPGRFSVRSTPGIGTEVVVQW